MTVKVSAKTYRGRQGWSVAYWTAQGNHYRVFCNSRVTAEAIRAVCLAQEHGRITRERRFDSISALLHADDFARGRWSAR